MSRLSRRQLIATGVAGLAGLSGIAVARQAANEHGWLPPDAGGIFGCGHTLTYTALRFLSRHSHAREFTREQISRPPHTRTNLPKGDQYKALQADGFRGWRLRVDGLVQRPATLSLAEIQQLPSRSQITQLICEEGWSYIAQWDGAPLAQVLTATGALPSAKFAIFETMDGWIDAIDLDDATHPQTLLCYKMNDEALPPAHGGPLRLRVPRQLGYKSLKYITRLTLSDTLQGKIAPGDYSWYAGI